MQPDPLVSVLTPSFNQGRWLEKNIQSVASQSYTNIEHIIMDGDSSDNTKDILRRAPSSISWQSEPDKGQSHAINKAFAASTGNIIGWINSDDAYFHRKSVEWVVEAFERHPGADVVYGHAAILNSLDQLLHLKWVPRYSQRMLLVYNFLVQPAVFVRRSAITGDRFVDDRFDYTMDRALWLGLAQEQRSFIRLNRILAIDREHAERKSASLERLWADRRPLDAEYGAPTGAWTRAARWLLHMRSRANGLRLVRKALEPATFVEDKPELWELISRQIARRRRNMPL